MSPKVWLLIDMADVLTPEQRQLNMSQIRGQHTKPEHQIRKALHARGLRFRLHCKELAGKPDLVFPKYKVVVFIQGCFWHRHDCSLFKLPGTRQEFWKNKLEANQARDIKNTEALRMQGWRVLNVWECSLRGPGRQPFEELINQLIHEICHGTLSSVDFTFK